MKPDTIAKSLAIGNPADGYFALDAVRQTGGGLAAVSDDEIVDGMRLLARTEGIFAETAGGVTVATLKRLAAEGVVRPDERVVAYVTGHGLKTLDAVAATAGPTAVIAPTLDAFHEAFPPTRPATEPDRPERKRSNPIPWPSPSASPPSCASCPAARPRSAPRAARSPRCSPTLEAAHPGFGERLFDDGGSCAGS